MENMLVKIFDNIICKEPEYTERGMQYDEKVEKIISPLYETMDRMEVERIRGMIYEATYFAQRDGFLMGTRAIIRIMCETTDCVDTPMKGDV